MIAEYEIVALTRAVPAHKLEVGDEGTVLHVHNSGEAYEVEFMKSGESVAVLTLQANAVRLLSEAGVASSPAVE